MSRQPNPNMMATASLQALTAAALCLPGLVLNPAQAAEQEATFSYGHYQEGHRKLYGATSDFNPVEVESLLGSTQFKLTDRMKFSVNYEQDTWGGATPVASMPLAFGGNGKFTGSNKILSGATPYLAPSGALFDQNLTPVEAIYRSDGSQTYQANTQVVDTLSLASPETRKQGSFNLAYEGDAATVEGGGGVSVEDDYVSGFGNINSSWAFNQKRTTVTTGLSYTHSNTYAIMDHDASGYISRDNTADPAEVNTNNGGINVQGTRQDWSTSLGLTQILNKSALIETTLGYTRSTGYMENPYKAVAVAFIDPLAQDQCSQAALGLLCADVKSLLEQRPDARDQWTGNLRYVQHISPFDAAVHLGYRIFSDDWGIMSHTFEADWVQPLGMGWTFTPRVRYYSQASADFYTPYLKTMQAAQSDVYDNLGRQIYVDGNNPDINYFYDANNDTYFDNQGNDVTDAVNNGDLYLEEKTKGIDRNKLPKHFSSDYRLAGYGAISGGVTLSKQFAKGVGLDLGFEYYSHQSALQLGGNNANSFNDFDAWSATATLKVDLAAVSLANAGQGGHANHHHHHQHGAHAPAGVMFDHLLPKAGDMMVGYRYMYGSQGGDMLHGTHTVGNQALVGRGCGPNPCFVAPETMSMDMHMLDLMYAPTDWLTLMLMPQFMNMSMTMERLRSSEYDSLADNNVGNTSGEAISGHIPHHLQNGHETGGFGDLGMYALVKLFDNGSHHVHIATGLSAPTGDVNIELRRNHQVDGGFIHYGMQLGSGTWDFKPSLTYTGHWADFSWGTQANGTLRMEAKNQSGYALGDMFQATAWGGYNLTPWLTASVRGVYTLQGGVKNQFDGLIEQFGPMDYPSNYGGRYWDVGFGLSAMVLTGDLMGNRLSVEWLQPVEDYAYGYQLERNGALTATWAYAF